VRHGQVRFDGGDDDSCVDRDEINAGQRHAQPGVDDDPFVEHAVEEFDHAALGGETLRLMCRRRRASDVRKRDTRRIAVEWAQDRDACAPRAN